MLTEISLLLLVVGLAQALVLSAFLFLPPQVRLQSNRLLALVLFSVAAGFGELLLYGAGISFRYPGLAYTGTVLSLLQLPALALYCQALMYREFTLRPVHALHLLPFITGVVLFFSVYFPLPGAEQLRILKAQDMPGMPVSLPLALLYHGVFIVWLGYILSRLHTWRRGLCHISSAGSGLQMRWLSVLLAGYIALWLVSIICCLVFYLLRLTDKTAWVLLAAGIAGFVFINTLLVGALRQSSTFAGLTREDAELLASVGTPATTASPAPEAGQLDKLRQLMQSTRPFLDARLSLSQLARLSGCTPHELSSLINNGFGQNFASFISEYRIAFAKELLARPGNTDTILEVMYACGFNSKSVFNTAFKKDTGMTPTEYRRQQKTPGNHE
ncbi:helix-turn-helix domain-containing protein [Shimwellia blattae]|uniref:Putative transcriptional regulatory protein n=1 Tax=Shimwellia blattae (strain ATCC 29907 / DSM 4481 / JCM 1650 / NBRC 105725 / CDC 9005-74) TaxID=630626 RepID=I2B4T4_SHIBC|nr:AraC family transcriptional regulator [Shimwellia blattae]AFJ45538.1 putative transcriptional regulatory protein [Shimwellia blattae DSM 4481 = NBRC 105725]GAB81522.1 putative AraC family transcriptional regulator [Shimwellia blattae DSM 4481 = NBRC 105725]VDY63021.1 Bacillibactin transport regulator [Shimwellia blattae]VEC20142.1 Bacillibactin transport regulator [Shimwellia blattae]